MNQDLLLQVAVICSSERPTLSALIPTLERRNFGRTPSAISVVCFSHFLDFHFTCLSIRVGSNDTKDHIFLRHVRSMTLMSGILPNLHLQYSELKNELSGLIFIFHFLEKTYNMFSRSFRTVSARSVFNASLSIRRSITRDCCTF